MPHQLPDLPYPHDALEPTIDKQTMELHHGKHHNTYVTKLNDAVKGTEFDNMPIDDVMRKLDQVPENIRTAVRNNGGGHANHSLFWEIMKPGGSKEPTGELAEAIKSTFGSLDDLKAAINAAGAGQFGSGWAWLVVDASGNLQVRKTPNQDTPLSEGMTPILGVDVWEHAYYLKYQNKRPEYLENWWNVVNWDVVGENYKKAKS
jgi:Fe-Mn family superoxide dismutase